MIEIQGNIWEYADKGYIVVPTNGTIKKNGANVMGRGVAVQLTYRIHYFPMLLGDRLRTDGNFVHVFGPERIVTFPVKTEWYEKADLDLIRRSTDELRNIGEQNPHIEFYMPRVGCGNGGLSWDVVRLVLVRLGKQFTVVNL